MFRQIRLEKKIKNAAKKIAAEKVIEEAKRAMNAYQRRFAERERKIEERTRRIQRARYYEELPYRKAYNEWEIADSLMAPYEAQIDNRNELFAANAFMAPYEANRRPKRRLADALEEGEIEEQPAFNPVIPDDFGEL